MKTNAEVIAALEAALVDPDLHDEDKTRVRRALDYMRGEYNEIREVCIDADALRVGAGVARYDGLPEAEVDALWRAFLAVADVCDPEGTGEY